MKTMNVEIIDWLSLKLNGLAIVMAFISGNVLLQALAGVATASTILYNAVRIYKEFKKKKK